MSEKKYVNYYIKRKKKLLRQFEDLFPIIKDLIEKKYKDHNTDKIFKKMKNEYENLIPEIPYIGGPTNSYSFFLLDGINVLAIIRVLEKLNFTYRQIGEFIYEFYETLYKIKNKNLEKIGQDPANRIFKEDYINYIKILAEKSQKRIYPFDYVFKFVESDGKTFNYGFNYTECGIHKLFKNLGAEKYTPFICLGDFADGNMSGFGLMRTQTLGNGASLCDHRYVKNATTKRAWPPDDVEEFKMDLE